VSSKRSDLAFLQPSNIQKFIFGATQTTGPGRISRTPDEIQRALLQEIEGGRTILGPVSDSQAMRVAAVWACVRLLSTAVAMLPLALYRKEGEKNVIDPQHPVHQLLSLRPNFWQTPFEFWQMVVAHILMKGNFYAQKVVFRGQITDLLWLDPNHTSPEMTDNGLVYNYEAPGKPKKVFKQSEILHIRGLCLDGVRGLGVLEAARNSIAVSLHMEQHGAAMMDNKATPSGVLQTELELSDDAFKRIRKDFEENYMGSHNAGRPMILEGGLKWQSMSMNAEDLAFIDQRKLTRSEIAMFFGVPPHMIGDIERGTSWGSGIEQQNLGFLVHTLMPYLINIQQACLRDLLPLKEQPNFVVKFDTDLLTRADFVARQNGLQIQKRNGVISANEWRKIEGKDPIDVSQYPEADDYVSSGPGASAPEGAGGTTAGQGAGKDAGG
jgi:HK97 family phage portal protein